MVGLEISELCKPLAILAKTAEIWRGLLIKDLAGAEVSTLGEPFPANITVIWSFAYMATSMGLYI